MKKFIGYIGWIIGIVVIVIGFVFTSAAKMEISSNYRYTWKPPYTSYEAQVITIRNLGIILLIVGVVYIGLKVFKVIYTQKHIQDIDQLTQVGGATKCAGCGLSISANVDICPRCGKSVKNGNINKTEYDIARFCNKCGSKINGNETFCPKCGNKIN